MARRLTADQQHIVETLDRPLFVAAGAGSGKSSTLAERVAWALTPGSGKDGRPYLNSLDEALIITYTHAAADEIREKIRVKLREAGLMEAALQVDSAWISTIHGMCSRILHAHALDLGIDPKFELVLDTDSEEMLEAAVETVVADIVQAGAYPELRKAFDLRGRNSIDSGSTVIGMVKELRSKALSGVNGFDSVVFPGEDYDAWHGVNAFHQALLAAKDVVTAPGAFKPGKINDPELFFLDKNLSLLEAFLSHAPDSISVSDYALLAKGLHKPSLSAFRKGRPLASVPVWKDARETFEELMNDLAFAINAAFGPDLLEIARKVDEQYCARKASIGVLDNDDLLRLTHDAFAHHPDLRDHYAKKFKLVMVDEFQDTNEQQVQMVSGLSGEDACHLATVGDAQQSIYRFRGADVSVFTKREREMPESSIVRLTMNFRSHPDILSFVDRVCGQGLLPGFMSLEPCPTRRDRYASRSLPRVSIELTTGEYGASDGRKAVGAAQIAERIERYIEAGTSPDDVALLMGSMKGGLAYYLDALRSRGIDCVVTGGSMFSAAPEVSVVCALLSLLANPKDTNAGLYTVLASEMFLIDADDLCALSTCLQENLGVAGKRGIDRGLLDFEFMPGITPSNRLLKAREVLGRAFARMGTWATKDLLLGIARESGWLSRLERRGPEGQAILANVLAAIRYAAELCDNAGLGLSRAALEFSRWLGIAKRGPASLAGGTSGAVSVMTVHSSKGLEFPLVVAVECWGSYVITPPSGLVCENIDGGVYAALVPKSMTADIRDNHPENVGACRTKPDWARFLSFATMSADAAEDARLLYVALTRAKEALIVGVSTEVSSNGCKPPLAGDAMAPLFPEGLPEPGECEVDYGGSAPAHVRSFHVGKNPALKDDPTAEKFVCDVGDTGFVFPEGADSAGVIELFDSAVEDGIAQVGESAQPLRMRSGVFSYSSAHAKMAASFTPQTSADGASAEQPLTKPLAKPKRLTSVEDADDLEGPGLTDDEDKATNLGSAFHELAQTMVETGRIPNGTRVDEMCRTWNIPARAKARLVAALDRWGRSDIRAEALSHAVLRAEVPFFQRVSSVFGEYVEGAIDLLCTDPGSDEALVIDYKTGDLGLTESQIRSRHEMQANFYAHVLMNEGFTRVECAFVCVEVEREDGQPHVERYSFGPDVLPVIDFGGDVTL